MPDVKTWFSAADAINEWTKGDIQRGIDMFYASYCAKHDYITTHNLGVLILYENDYDTFYPSGMVFGKEELWAIDLLKKAEKLNPKQERNILAMSFSYYLYKDYHTSMSILRTVKPKCFTNSFLWLTSMNYIALNKYDNAWKVLEEIITAHSDQTYLFWSLQTMMHYKTIYKETVKDILPLYRECIRKIDSEIETVDDWTRFDDYVMLEHAIPTLLLCGEQEDYEWLRRKSNELPMTDAEKQMLIMQNEQSKNDVLNEIDGWNPAKEIILDLFDDGDGDASRNVQTP